MTSTADDAPRDRRDETENERHDRNWSEILQELRVIQTGTQILTGFLLTLAFQPRFAELDGYQVGTYLALVVVAAFATALALIPVALHRALFHRHAKSAIIRIANLILRVTLAAVGLTLAGTSMLIFDVVLGREAGLIAACVALVVVVAAWLVLPDVVRRKYPRA
ncbi:MAG: sodium:proton antiporter [Salinibacterium sp.]|nr:sodium:proton antiporter [Salinibacterium sp.]